MATFQQTQNPVTSFNNSLTKSFIDLATYDQHEQGMYGGNDAITYFVRKVVKATWFAKGIAQLTKGSQVTNWGSQQDIDFTISRAGDYLLNSWLRISLPSVSVNNAALFAASGGVSANIRWTRNLAHNLFSDYQMTFNDLQVDIKKGSHFYDFFTAFTVPASKRVGYDNMIGNVNALINPLADALDPDTPGLIRLGQLQAYTLNLPLITPFSRDTGVALPTAALPYNEMKFKFTVRPWSDLLIADGCVATVGGSVVDGGSYNFNANNSLVQIVPDAIQPKRFGASQPAATYTPSLNLTQAGSSTTLNTSLNIECFCEYAIVSNQERVRMGSCPRDILIEQSQQVVGTRMQAGATNTRQDIRFSYPVKALMFGVENITNVAEHSNYSVGNPVVGLNEYSNTILPNTNFVNRVVLEGFRYDTDPISVSRLLYENDIRYELPADYFSLVAPYTNATTVPDRTGYHLYNYALDLASVDPKGSTNYGKLTNATKEFVPSVDFVNASQPGTFNTAPNNSTTAGGQGIYFTTGTNISNLANAYQLAIVAVNHNFVRVSGGALGFPVL